MALWAQYSYALGLGLTRCSICALFIRVFSTRPFKRIGRSLSFITKFFRPLNCINDISICCSAAQPCMDIVFHLLLIATLYSLREELGSEYRGRSLYRRKALRNYRCSMGPFVRCHYLVASYTNVTTPPPSLSSPTRTLWGVRTGNSVSPTPKFTNFRC